MFLKCKHCSSEAISEGKDMEYSKEHIVKLLNSIKGHKDIFITGGEPLVHNDILNIIKYIKLNVRDVTIGMFTAGIIFRNNSIASIDEEFAGKLYLSGLELCYVSVYDDNSEFHDWMTGIKGSFNMTKISIFNLIQAGVEIRFNTVVTKKNIDKLNEIKNMAVKWGVSEIRLLKLINHGRARECRDTIGISESEYFEIVKKYVNNTGSIRITASSTISITPCRPFDGTQMCQAGCGLLYVTYDGGIYPCASKKNDNDYLIGKIFEIERIIKYLKNSREYLDYMLC